MNVRTNILLYLLWFAHPVLETVIAAFMLRRGQHRTYRYFFAYIVAQILTFAVVFPTYLNNYSTGFYVSSLSTAISVVLGFQVIHEAFVDIFRPFHTLRDLGTVLFRWAGLVMLLVAGVVSVSTNSSDTVPWVQAIMTAERCVRIIQVGMVLFLLLFARYLGVSRRQHSFGICLGFGIFAVVELALNASWAGYRLAEVTMNLINMAAYDCALIVWLWYTFAKSLTREAGSILLRPQRWEQSLSDLHHPLPEDSLIPMFEGMVDRALSRTQATPILGQDDGVAPPAATVVPTNVAGLSKLAAKVGSTPTG